MQLQFKKPGPEQRLALRGQLSRLRDPECLQEILSSHVPSISGSSVEQNCYRWLDTFRDAYLAAMLGVSSGNVSFYHGVTLLRETYIVCRLHPAEAPMNIRFLSHHAQAAFEEVVSAKISKWNPN